MKTFWVFVVLPASAQRPMGQSPMKKHGQKGFFIVLQWKLVLWDLGAKTVVQYGPSSFCGSLAGFKRKRGLHVWV